MGKTVAASILSRSECCGSLEPGNLQHRNGEPLPCLGRDVDAPIAPTFSRADELVGRELSATAIGSYAWCHEAARDRTETCRLVSISPDAVSERPRSEPYAWG